MNSIELKKKVLSITSKLLSDKGYISLIDIFENLGYLTKKDIEAWRKKKIPYLEKCINVNLSKASLIVRTVRRNCLKGKLEESFTAYRSWGKGRKTTLRFSKSGKSNIENAYATHFIKAKNMV